jgi:transmembrane sensor
MSGPEVTESGAADLDEVAASWFQRLESARGPAAPETRRLFQRWLEANADHADAFVRTVAVWEEIGAHAATPEIMSLRQAAIADARAAAQARWRPAARVRPDRWPAAAAAGLVAAIGLGFVANFWLRPAPAQVFATTVGERHSVTLADNSRVDIDADSEIAVTFTPERRRVQVIRGQAFFAVEKDPARPFIVGSGGRSVIDTGTQFDVEALDRGLRVTLIEGRVLVRHDDAKGAEEELVPNDQLTDVAGSPPELIHLASTLAATAWRQGKLLFDDEPLAAAIASVNRYSQVKVEADPSVAAIRIGGAFDAGDIRAFVNAVTTYYPVKAVTDRPGVLRLVRR